MKEKVIQAFRKQFGAMPQWVVRAPGRVNLIGDHTDYNDGFVLPMAIERAVWVAFRPQPGKKIFLQSLDFNEVLDLDPTTLHKDPPGWKEYVKGIAWALQDARAQLSGWEGVVAGDIPIGSGLSSSAAFQLAIAIAFAKAANLSWKPEQMAKLVQKAENKWMGVNTGIMDPLISATAEEGKAALIDCRSLDLHHVALPAEVAVVIMNTMKERGLVDSVYNERRKQCEEVATHFGVSALRALEMDNLIAEKIRLSNTNFRRARHVISESERVIKVVGGLEANDLTSVGLLMRESHASLRDDFEVSCQELDTMVEVANGQPGCYGARMTGAGFGGCAVALVNPGVVEEFCETVADEYHAQIGQSPSLMIASPSQGLQILEIDD